MKFVGQNYDRYSSKWLVGDIGLQYYLFSKKSRRLGFVIKDLGLNLTPFLSESERVMPKIDAGGYFSFLDDNLSTAFDISFPDLQVGIGVENRITRFFSIRGGYRYSNINNSFLSGFSFGFGLGLKNIDVDYSFNPIGILGYSHQVTIIYKM